MANDKIRMTCPTCSFVTYGEDRGGDIGRLLSYECGGCGKKVIVNEDGSAKDTVSNSKIEDFTNNEQQKIYDGVPLKQAIRSFKEQQAIIGMLQDRERETIRFLCSLASDHEEDSEKIERFIADVLTPTGSK